MIKLLLFGDRVKYGADADYYKYLPEIDAIPYSYLMKCCIEQPVNYTTKLKRIGFPFIKLLVHALQRWQKAYNNFQVEEAPAIHNRTVRGMSLWEGPQREELKGRVFERLKFLTKPKEGEEEERELDNQNNGNDIGSVMEVLLKTISEKKHKEVG